MKANVFTKQVFYFLNKSKLIFAAVLIFPVLSFAQFPYAESFQNSTAPAVNFSGNPVKAYLTSGVTDPVGNGYLQLTSNSGNQSGTAFSSAIFPSNNGLTAEFEFYMYDGTSLNGKTGDGFSFFLFDAAVKSADFRTGANGGALGYAQKKNPAIPGISNGYIGIGFDAFGNFSNPSDGRNGGPGIVPNAVVIRGPGDGSSLTKDYPYVAGQATDVSPYNFSLSTSSRDPFITASNYRKARIQMMPVINSSAIVTGFTITVKITVGGDTSSTYTLINNQLFNYPPPQYLKFGFSGATGGASNYNDIRNFTITVSDINGLTPPTVNDDNYTGCLNSPIYFDPTVNDETPNDGNLFNPGENINKSTIDFDFDSAGFQQTKTIDGKGTFSANADGVVTFTPVTGFNGTVDCDYYVSDVYGKAAVNPGTIQVTVNTNTPPVLTVNSPQTTCAPSSIDITASPGVWSATPGGGTTGYYYNLLADSAIQTPSSIDSNGTYFIQYTGTNGCKVIKPVEVTISSSTSTPSPVNSFNCGPSSVVLSATGAGAGEDYKWYDAATGGNVVQAGGDTFHTPALNATTNYFVSKYNTSTAGCESNRTEVVATINPAATTADAGADQMLGDVDTVSLIGNAFENNESGAWTFVSGPNTPVILNPTDNNASATNVVPGTYVFKWTIQRGTCFSEDYVQVTIGTILPVKLISFDGTLRNNTVSLNWSTATETNNDHFDVQRSTDGINFDNIVKVSYVKGNGNSNVVNTYNYKDNISAITQAVINYRLKQVDVDGKSSFSKVVPIHISDKDFIVLMFPNPFKADIRMQATFATAGNVSLLITDLNGKVVSKQSLAVTAGFNDIQVRELQYLNAGVYSVEIIQNQKRIYTGRLVKQ